MAWKDEAREIRREAMAPFLTAASYTPAGGSPFAVNVVFTADAERLFGGEGGTPVPIRVPVAEIMLDDFTTPPAQGGTLVVDGTTYEVEEVEPESRNVGAALILRLPQ